MRATPILFFLLLFVSHMAQATEPVPSEAEAKSGISNSKSTTEPAVLDKRVEDIKNEVLNLNRDMFILEEQLLFPSNTQFAVYLSVDVGEYFELESARVLLDNKPVASYLYTERESRALHRGGVHRLYLGNLTSGKHELVAYYTGKGPKGRDFKRAVTKVIEKGMGPRYVELKISDDQGKKQADLIVKEWQN